MSNAIANSFALLNEIKQELNQQRVIIPQRPSSKSPSPTKINFSGLLNQGTTRPQDQRTNSLHQNTRISKKEDISRSRLNNNIENNPPISNYYSDRNVPYQKKTMKS